MISLPDFSKTFEYENNFYLSCDSTRIGKILAHYELFKMSAEVPGAIIECGVFKGASLARFAMFRKLFDQTESKRLIGFDTFGKFPETTFVPDQSIRKRFVDTAGEQSISSLQMLEVLKYKGIEENLELVTGDITKTLPAYVKKNPNLKISLLNLDTDIYEPAVTILKYLFPLISKGGILILDDYAMFPGETKAVDEYFKGRKGEIKKFPFSVTPHYIVKK